MQRGRGARSIRFRAMAIGIDCASACWAAPSTRRMTATATWRGSRCGGCGWTRCGCWSRRGNPLKPRAGMAGLADRLASARRISDGRRILATAIESRLGTRFTSDTLLALQVLFPRGAVRLADGGGHPRRVAGMAALDGRGARRPVRRAAAPQLQPARLGRPGGAAAAARLAAGPHRALPGPGSRARPGSSCPHRRMPYRRRRSARHTPRHAGRHHPRSRTIARKPTPDATAKPPAKRRTPKPASALAEGGQGPRHAAQESAAAGPKRAVRPAAEDRTLGARPHPGADRREPRERQGGGYRRAGPRGPGGVHRPHGDRDRAGGPADQRDGDPSPGKDARAGGRARPGGGRRRAPTGC